MAVGQVSKVYLVFYNAVLAVGWFVILGMTTQQFITEGGVHGGIYAKVKVPLKIFQTAAIMEVVHCIIGLVPSSVVLTAFQVASRLFLTWCVVHTVPEVQNNAGIGAFILAWSVTEVIRYSFYVCSLVHSVPYALQWCRYTFFIVLYPVGVTGELLTIYASLPYVLASGIYSISLPNPANFLFSYYHFLILTMLLYIPVFPQLYLHMLRQRKKVLVPQSKKAM